MTAVIKDVKVGSIVKVISNPTEESPFGYTEEMDEFVGLNGVVIQNDGAGAVVAFPEKEDYWAYGADNLDLLGNSVGSDEPTVGSSVKILSMPSDDLGVTEEMKAAIGKTVKVVVIRCAADRVPFYAVDVGASRPYFFAAENIELVER